MIAACKQNRGFNFAQLLYFNQGPENGGWLDDAMVAAAATSIPGVNVAALQRRPARRPVERAGGDLRQPGARRTGSPARRRCCVGKTRRQADRRRARARRPSTSSAPRSTQTLRAQ